MALALVSRATAGADRGNMQVVKSIHRAGLLGLMMLTALLAGCSSSSNLPPAPAADAESASLDTGYELGAGDRIRLTVFRQENLSGEFEIDGGGALAMPFVGDIEAAGLSARELEDRIEQKLVEGQILIGPQVSVEVLNYRPFYIIGEVQNPGSYPYVSGMTVVNAVALAGGYTYRSDQDAVSLERQGEQYSTAPSTPVLPGDVIKVPERWF